MPSWRQNLVKTRHSYKGGVIESRVLPLRGGGWTAHFSIETHRGPDVLDTPFETGRRFPTQDAELEASLQIGMHKIETGFDATVWG